MQGARDEKKAAKEEAWLKQIEQQAMKDYRTKDLQVNHLSGQKGHGMIKTLPGEGPCRDPK